MSKQIVITGGGGYIGSVLTKHLLNIGHKVKCIDRFYFGLESIQEFVTNKNYNYVQKDIRFVKENDLMGSDIVMDLAGISNDPASDLNPILTRKINHKGAVNIAKMAKTARVPRYIMASSCSIYGASDGELLFEDSDLKPVSLYAKCKVAAEKDILGLADDEFCITFLRLATVFGLSPRMRFDLIVNIMTMYATTKGRILITGGGKQWRPLVHVQDVAGAFTLVMNTDSKIVNKNAFNIGSNNQNYQVATVGRIIQQSVPMAVEVEVVPDDEDKRNYNVSFAKAQEILGYKTNFDVQFGVKEIFDAITSGKIDPQDPRSVTVKYYSQLIHMDKVLSQIKIKGRLF